MKRIIGIILALAFVLSLPAAAADSNGEALVRGKNFDFVKTDNEITNINNWFDGDYKTHGMMSNLKGHYVMFSFRNPTDLTAISFSSVNNGDWAMIKDFELGYYNLETKYQPRLKYPEPVYQGTVYTLEKKADKQTIDLSGNASLKKITHLILKIDDVYLSSTGALWGGLYELELEGIPDKTQTVAPVSSAIASNVEIMDTWGLLKSNYEKTDKPKRIDGADLMLKMNGEYDTAQSFVGPENFADAADKPCALNRESYIYAYKKFGIEGDENDNFKPKADLEAKAFYKMILTELDYYCDIDYTWDTMQSFLRGLGSDGLMGDMLYCDPFTVKDMCNVVWEALNTKPKGSDVVLAEKLHAEGKLPDNVWQMFAVKYNKQTVEIDRTECAPPDTANRSGDFTFYTAASPHEVTDYNFMYNACFGYSGVYYGTLPKNDPRNQREEFAQALKTIGAKSLRWPGGNAVHWYFMEDGSKKFADTLFEDAAVFNGRRPGGFYDPKDPDDAYYAQFFDFMDFCKEYNIDTLIQINPFYYIDEGDANNPNDDRVRAVMLSDLNTKAASDGSRYTMNGYYDGLRISEGAEALRKNLREMKRRGYNCEMWEIGNEDVWKDYSGEPYASNPYYKDLFRMYVAYASVIKEEFPDSKVVIDTFDIPLAISSGLLTAEESRLFDAVTDHYPFASWGSPGVDEGNTNAWSFITNNEQSIDKAWTDRKDLDWGVGERMITESTAYRFQNWNASCVEHTFANALVLAHNWGEAVFDTGWTLSCLHDLESPWFGNLLHDVRFNTASRFFYRKHQTFTDLSEDDIPDRYKFENSYFTNAAGRAYEILGRHSGGEAFKNSESNMFRYVSGYSTINGDEIKLTIVNSLNETRPVTVKYTDMAIPAQTVHATELRTEDIFAVMPEDYIVSDDREVYIKGNVNDPTQNAIELDVKPFSVTQLTFKVN